MSSFSSERGLKDKSFSQSVNLGLEGSNINSDDAIGVIVFSSFGNSISAITLKVFSITKQTIPIKISVNRIAPKAMPFINSEVVYATEMLLTPKINTMLKNILRVLIVLELIGCFIFFIQWNITHVF